MPYGVEVREVASQPLAVVRDRATIQELGSKIGQLFPKVYAFLKDSTVQQSGHNVVVYWDGEGTELLFTAEGVPIEVGVQVATAFAGEGAVVCSASPAGTVATTVHMGPYSQLYEAHQAVRDWCKAHNRRLAGPNWEVYGDWSDDPARLRTDVYYLLN